MDDHALMSPAGRLRALVDHVPIILAVLDPDGVIVEANPAALAASELTSDEMLGRKLWETGHWPNDDAERLRLERLVQRAAGGEPMRHETRIEARSGRALRIAFSLHPVRDANDRVVLIAVEARDVTAAGEAELELRLSREKYRGIVSISADAVITIDEQQRILDFNDGAAAIFGWTAAEVAGQPLDMLIPESVRESHRRHVVRFGEGEVAARHMGERREIAGLRKDGTTFPADASISKLDVNGKRIYAVVLRDVTAQHRAVRGQRFLARAGALLATSLDVETTLASIAALVVEDMADCCVIYQVEAPNLIRRASMATDDASFTSVLDRLRGRRLHPDSLHPVVSVLETGEAELLTDLASRVDSLDTESDLMLFAALPVRSAMIVPLKTRGRTTGAIGFYSAATRPAYDAEDLKIAVELATRAALALDNAHLYREATDAIRARDDVLSVVSHDLGNPISAIRIGVSLLLRSRSAENPPGEGWEYLAGIKQSVEQMERLIRDLLEVKRIEAGHLSLVWETLTAASLFEDTVDLMSALAVGKGITLTTRTQATTPAFRADRERILQVLSNLVGNAVKFTQSGGAVEICAEASGSDVIVSVRDNGPGIEPQHVDQIFDRFWQAHRNQREGIGLGLAIVRSIVEAHGGRVWAESQPGAGTTISFALKAVPDASPPERLRS
jgi:PAS domain S-box-containing protein